LLRANQSDPPTIRYLSRVTGFFNTITGKFRAALPPLWLIVIGSIGWCAALSLCVWFNARLTSWGNEAQRIEVLLIVAGGAFLSFLPGVMLARLVAGRKGQSQFMSALVIGLALSTIGSTAVIYLFNFRSYYAFWHDHPGEHDWYWQQFFTTASAFYQFAVLGMRLYLPFGPLVLIIAAYILSTKRL
jgi:hypothetical protein